MAIHRYQQPHARSTIVSFIFVISMLAALRWKGRNSHVTTAFEMSPRRRVFSATPKGVTPGQDGTPRLIPSKTTKEKALMLSGGQKEVKSKNSVLNKSLLHEMFAELIGMFVIVQIGCGTVCSAVYLGAQTGLWQIAVVWSIAVTLGITTTAAVSGAHLNPAISIALALLRPDACRWGKVLPYTLAQLAGAILAAGANLALFGDAIAKFESVKGIVRGSTESVASAVAFGEYFTGTSVTVALLAEAIGTAMLAFVVFALTNPKNETTQKSPMMIPPLIGATVGALISVIAPLTQAGFNPARDFGPRIVTLLAGWGKTVAMKGWWVYVLGPIVGAPVGGFIADRLLFADKAET